jgi:hypothetical protein
MRSGRFWVLAGVVLALGVTALGWFVGASPFLAQASANESQRLGIETQNAAMMVEIAAMREQFENLDELTVRLDELQVSVPGFADTGSFFDEVAATAAASGVSIQSISVDGAQPYGAMGSTVSSAQPAPAAEGEAAETTTPAPPTASVPTPGSLTPPTVPGSALAQNLYVLGLTLELDADENQLSTFLAGLRSDGRRLMLVTEVTSSFGTSQRSTIKAFIFVVHDPRLGPVGSLPAPTPAPTPEPAEPVESATPAPTATPTPTGTPKP